jgi:hypothetical protein
VGDRLVKLTYQIPAGVDHVAIMRSAGGRAGEQIVYTGKGTTFTDRGLSNGTEYRYVVTGVDDAGNASAGVAIVVMPKKNFLRAPKDGARLRKAPKLAWSRTTEADYYTVQVYRGKIKILSAWPKRPTRVLAKKWKFQGRSYSLVPGVYTWYVWPGYGARSAFDYGGMLGSRTFQIIR